MQAPPFKQGFGSHVPSEFCIKSKLHYTRGITLKRVTSGRAHLLGLAPQLRKNVAALARRWRYCVRFDRPEIGIRYLAGPTAMWLTTELTIRLHYWKSITTVILV